MITLEELSEAVYEDLNGRIVAVDSTADVYRVFFECDDWNDCDRRRRFELVFNDVPESTATPVSCGSLQAVADHPILWSHNEQHAAMFFSSPPSNPVELVGRLHETHERLFGGWRPISEFLHASSTLLTGGHGLLAQGPESVIAEYATAIGNSLRFSIVRSHIPRGGYRIMIFDECYVVFREIEIVEHRIAT